jgi:hypothetical protein
MGLYSIGDRIINECGTVGGIKIGRQDWGTQWKPAPVPLHPPQILHDLHGTVFLLHILFILLMKQLPNARLEVFITVKIHAVI